jgi:hypothetical protein
MDQFLLPLLHDGLSGSTIFHFGLGIITKNLVAHISVSWYLLSPSNTGGQQLTDIYEGAQPTLTQRLNLIVAAHHQLLPCSNLSDGGLA